MTLFGICKLFVGHQTSCRSLLCGKLGQRLPRGLRDRLIVGRRKPDGTSVVIDSHVAISLSFVCACNIETALAHCPGRLKGPADSSRGPRQDRQLQTERRLFGLMTASWPDRTVAAPYSQGFSTKQTHRGPQPKKCCRHRGVWRIPARSILPCERGRTSAIRNRRAVERVG